MKKEEKGVAGEKGPSLNQIEIHKRPLSEAQDSIPGGIEMGSANDDHYAKT